MQIHIHNACHHLNMPPRPLPSACACLSSSSHPSSHRLILITTHHAQNRSEIRQRPRMHLRITIPIIYAETVQFRALFDSAYSFDSPGCTNIHAKKHTSPQLATNNLARHLTGGTVLITDSIYAKRHPNKQANKHTHTHTNRQCCRLIKPFKTITLCALATVALEQIELPSSLRPP